MLDEPLPQHFRQGILLPLLVVEDCPGPQDILFHTRLIAGVVDGVANGLMTASLG